MTATTPLIVDTDAGFDDVLAITYLLASGAPIEAFTLVNGISDVDEGARALLLLQEKAGLSTPIPIYKGSRQPMAGSNQFPDEWRHQATQIIEKKFIGPHQPAYDAWDPLAAVALGTPSVLVEMMQIDVEVVQSGTDAGETVKGSGAADVSVAGSASAAIFKDAYTAGFAAHDRARG
jgi:inosine-uridine nucleoside N-ribohydrolase